MDAAQKATLMRVPGSVLHGCVVAMVAWAAAACETSDLREDPDASGQILEAVQQYYADFSARDWDAFRSHFWPGATLTTVWQPPGADEPRVVVTGIDTFVARAPEGPGSREVFEERMLSADVRRYGNLAQVWARYEARFGDPGEIMEWRGYDAFTLMRHGGQWKIVSLSYTNEEGEQP